MTIKEAAQKAGVSETVVKRWCAEGRVNSTKVGRSWEVDAASLEEYLRQPVRGRGQDRAPRVNARKKT